MSTTLAELEAQRWVISGSGNAKTETVQAPAGAGAVVTSTITSAGALLSATSVGR